MIAKTGSQSILCSMPLRYDSYIGCTHGCLYCFATKANKKFKTKEEYFKNISNGNIKELENFLKNPSLPEYMKGVAIHWGGMSDGFQPIEKERQVSYESLKLFAKYKYPVVISTKGVSIISSDKYIELLKKCNVVIQVSLINRKPEDWDKGAPIYRDRIEGIKKLIKNGIKVIVRNQPYMVHNQKDIVSMINELKGVEGFIVEGLKDRKSFAKNLVRIGGEFMYPIDVLFKNFKELKKECKKNSIKFFVGENRLRWMGDSVNCCGVGHIKGFEDSNRLNSTLAFFGERIGFFNIGRETGFCDGLVQDTISHKALKKMRGAAPTNAITQDTIGSKVLAAQNKNSGDYGFYNYIKFYINNGTFVDDYELEAVGKDKEGNYVFEYKNKAIEAYRRKIFRNKK